MADEENPGKADMFWPSRSMTSISANAVTTERADDASFNKVPCPLCGMHLAPRMGRRGPIIPCLCPGWRD